MYSPIRFNLAWSLAAALSLCLVCGAANAGPKAYVGNFKDNTVSVVDTTAGTVATTIPIAAGPHGMVISSDGRRLFASSDGSSVISVIDTVIDRVTGTVEVGKSPHGIALVPGKDLLLVAVNGEDKIAFVDTAKLAVIAMVGVGKPHTIGVSPDGKAAYVSSQVPGHFAVAVIDLAGRTVLRTIPLDKTPRDLEYSFDGKVYFTEAGANTVMVLDPASDKIIAEIPTGVSPHYVNHPRNSTFGMAIVQGPGELFLFDPKTDKPVRGIKVGNQPHWLAVSGDGKTAYVTNEGSNTLSIVDIASGKTVTIAVGNQPRKVVVQALTAGGAAVSIVNFAFQPQVVTISPGDSVLWSNRDGGPHAVAFKDGSDGSDTLFPGKTYSRMFERPGSYDYYCSIHEYMTGRVEVRKQ